jgi:hypothetical protein
MFPPWNLFPRSNYWKCRDLNCVPGSCCFTDCWTPFIANCRNPSKERYKHVWFQAHDSKSSLSWFPLCQIKMSPIWDWFRLIEMAIHGSFHDKLLSYQFKSYFICFSPHQIIICEKDLVPLPNHNDRFIGSSLWVLIC